MPDGGQDIRVSFQPSATSPEIVEHRRRRAALSRAASLFLWESRPADSAREGLSAGQKSGLWAVAGALSTFSFFAGEAMIFGLSLLGAALFASGVGLRLAAALRKLTRKRAAPAPETICDVDAPTFTLLIPLYKEAEVARQSVQAMARLDYPRDRLQILYLIEADDEATLAALQACLHIADFDIIALPHGEPRTKPRALNYGLGLAHGDVITVFDAEDVPEPDQLRKAAARFSGGADDLAVVQAELSPHNASASWIARQFTMEYDILFRVWAPYVTAHGWPLSLGGTSNHFRAAHLRRVGGWDPYNVTEDADLGFRLAMHGCKAAMIASRTHEEAPVRLGQWLNQRSRWIKGHLQTWIVVMRDPMRRMRGMGVGAFIGLQMTFTLSLLASFLHGPLLIWTIWKCLDPDGYKTLAYLGLLSTGYLSAALLALAGGRRPGRMRTVLTTPFYWPLQSLAAMRALWEMRSCPHKWSKTQHGLSPAPAAFTGLETE